MGDCNSSKIAKMQLFHELKQQFPTLSDSIVKDCIKENGYDRETCTRTLRATEESRPSRRAFPSLARNFESERSRAMSQEEVLTSSASISQPSRPESLDFEFKRPSVNSTRVPPINNQFSTSTPISGPANSGSFSSQEVFDDSNRAESAGFELNVNVGCSPSKNSGLGTPPVASRRSDSVYEPRNLFKEPYMYVNPAFQIDQTRGFTSVSLTLRKPSSDPQPPIDIRSQGSSLTYSTSSSDPRGFQSSVQISVAAGRIRPAMAPTRPSTLIPSGQFNSLRQSAGQPPRSPNQLPRPTTTMSAPTTPSVPPIILDPLPSSSPSTPLVPQAIKSPPSTPDKKKNELVACSSSQVTEAEEEYLEEQREKKNRLAQDVDVEKDKLEIIKKDIEMLLRHVDRPTSFETYKWTLEKEIAYLRIECTKMANEIDERSLPGGPGVPLGETNEEFYQHIYTGQCFVPRLENQPPPLPVEPPAWRETDPPTNEEEVEDEPSWSCSLCHFSNFYALPSCEQCSLPRRKAPTPGETQDIHIRVTHHHNFSPRRTVHSWVV